MSQHVPMMMLFSERVMTLSEAAAALPEKKSRSTLHRWCMKGVQGVLLECRRVGRKLFTSAEALDRFCARVAALHVIGPGLPTAPLKQGARTRQRRKKVEPALAAPDASEARGIDVARVLARAGIRQAPE